MGSDISKMVSPAKGRVIRQKAKTAGAMADAARGTGHSRTAARFAPPLTVSHAPLLRGGSDRAFRRSVYLMVLTWSRLMTCREAFGRALGLTGTQFAVLIGTAYQQGDEGVSIRALADHIQLAATHVTTEVGRLIGKGLLTKAVNRNDRRGVLVRLSRRGEAAVVKVTPLVRQVNDVLFAGLSRREFSILTNLLDRLASNSEAALGEIRRSQRARLVSRSPDK
jgi:MarR family transcriptional regulator, organic hydroperoxide resistance regulator